MTYVLIKNGEQVEVSKDEYEREVSRHVRQLPGLGDVVAGAANAVGIKKTAGCGCQKRQDAMNRATPPYVRRVLGWLREAPLPFTASKRA
jgi:pantoate kinase